MFSLEENLRYSCQMLLPGFGNSGQELIKNAKVLIIGAGGLGCPVAQYLVASGVGHLGIVDFDLVSLSNLHRQILYSHEDLNKEKAVIAASRLSKQNPFIEIVPFTIKITKENVFSIVSNYDIIVDCSDNFETRYLLNDACVIQKKPLIFGAIYQFEGHVAAWNLPNPDGTRSPNYRDLFPKLNDAIIPNCATGGVLSPLAGIIGSIQANEVLKYITHTGLSLAGKLLIFDSFNLDFEIIEIGTTTKTAITELPLEESINSISFKTLNEKYENNYYLIDVRSNDERNQNNIGGIHIPLNLLEQNIEKIPKDEILVFYCASGIRSAHAVSVFKKKYPNSIVFSLKDGLKNLSH